MKRKKKKKRIRKKMKKILQATILLLMSTFLTACASSKQVHFIETSEFIPSIYYNEIEPPPPPKKQENGSITVFDLASWLSNYIEYAQKLEADRAAIRYILQESREK